MSIRLIREGWIVIDGVKHFVIDAYVSCDRSLNQRAWNVTEAKSTCPTCSANQVKRLPDIHGQLKMF